LAVVRIVVADEIDRVLTYPALVDALAEAFRGEITVPVRHHYTIPQAGADATLLLMPAWTGLAAGQSDVRYLGTSACERFIGCKVVTVFPDNARSGRPSLYGQYLLLSGETGEPLALMEGRTLTAWRTAAASALAARHLARADASHLLMIGAGALAPHLVRAHASGRPIRRITLWNRTHRRAVALGFALAEAGFEVEVADNLDALAQADIVCCATLSSEPLVRGAMLKRGAHVDLVGGFTPKMREADDEALHRARIFVDTRAGAMEEAGDIVDPLSRGVIREADIAADLFDLCRRTAPGRRSADEITLFKSVGTAIEDLAAAMLVWNRIAGERADNPGVTG
jgi:ornithine cyclodeaminase/alanine dehydrogenase-like protein (mu-crystallin family)